MELTAVMLFVIGSVGLTHVIVDSVIFAPVRAWLQGWLPASLYKLFECYQCCGVWVGWFLGLLLFGLPMCFNEQPEFYKAAVYTFVSGFASSFLSYGGAVMLTYLEANSIVAPAGEEKNES